MNVRGNLAKINEIFLFQKLRKINKNFLFQKLQKSMKISFSKSCKNQWNFPFPKVAKINENFLFQKLQKSMKFSFSKSCKNQWNFPFPNFLKNPRKIRISFRESTPNSITASSSILYTNFSIRIFIYSYFFIYFQKLLISMLSLKENLYHFIFPFGEKRHIFLFGSLIWRKFCYCDFLGIYIVIFRMFCSGTVCGGFWWTKKELGVFWYLCWILGCILVSFLKIWVYFGIFLKNLGVFRYLS